METPSTGPSPRARIDGRGVLGALITGARRACLRRTAPPARSPAAATAVSLYAAAFRRAAGSRAGSKPTSSPTPTAIPTTSPKPSKSRPTTTSPHGKRCWGCSDLRWKPPLESVGTGKRVEGADNYEGNRDWCQSELHENLTDGVGVDGLDQHIACEGFHIHALLL